MLERVLAALIITVVTASGAVASSENPKGSLPAQGLGEYSTYREALLGNGWLPVAQENSVSGYPEVVCGNAFCSANWRSSGGREVGIALWPTHTYPYNRLILVVAPQYQDGF